MTSILLADDHEVLRSGLRGLLEAREGWVVCAEASTGRQAVAMARECRPEVAVLDLAMPELNGLEATRRIRAELPETEVLVFSMHESEHLVREALEAGARGYVLKSDAARHLVTAVESAIEHRPYFSGTVGAAIVGGFLRASDASGASIQSTATTLTGREREIVQLLAEGHSNRDVAAALAISVKTVETHRSAVMRKLGLHSLAELIRYAIRNGLAEA
jgi:DNA-binding NarL/FixJ family response regulator